MTLNELAYNIRNIAAAGQGNSDDNPLNIRQIYFWIRAYRAKGILDITNYGKSIDPQLVQDLGIIPLNEVDMSDDNCPTDISWGCTIKKITIPKLVDFPYNRGILFVGKIDKRTPFILDSADVSIFKEHTQFGRVMNRAYMIGNQMYFRLYGNDADMQYVNVRGVFENPEEVNNYATPGCTPKCYDPMVDQYPMPLSMYDYVTSTILSKELNMTLQTKKDEVNNAKEDKGAEQPVRG